MNLKNTGIFTAFIVGCSAVLANAQWVGPNLLNWNASGWSVSGQTGGAGGVTFTSGRLEIRSSNDITASKQVDVQSGKRYEVRASMGANRIVSGEYRVRVDAGSLGSTEWINTNESGVGIVEVVTNSSMLAFTAVFDKTGGSSSNYGIGQWASGSVRQVIYAPTIGFSSNIVEVMIDDPNASSVEVSLVPLLLSGSADAPDLTELSWGDGAISTINNFNVPASHSYSVNGLGLYEFTATLQAANIAGSNVDSATIRITVTLGCIGDIADDFGFTASQGGGPDGSVNFGDFLALLGRIGPCDGGTPGCIGDIADDFGTIAPDGSGDGQVSFGDFLALLGLIGPCA